MAERSPYRQARVRVTVGSAAVVFVVLAAAGWAVTTAQHEALVDNLEETLARVTDDVEALLDDPRGGSLAGLPVGDDDAVVQVVDDEDEVQLATGNIDGASALAPAPTGDDEVRTVRDVPGEEGEAFLLRSVVTDAGAVIHAAVPLDDVEESAAALRRAFLVAVPATTAVLAVALWFLVGRLLRQAEVASDRQRRFVADASHELRGPLTRMRTELEVDAAHPEAADHIATQRKVLEETVGLQHLVDDLLGLARLDDAGSSSPSARAPVDLDAVVSRVAADLRSTGTVVVDTSAVQPAQVQGQAEQLRRAVANLADNAARHARSAVRFEVAERDGTAVVAVVDDGPGVPTADRERIFERFSRLDEARTGTTGGTGLGLAIAREIVQRHGGTLEVSPDTDPGARFVIALPSI